ncbi:hypothetical protein PQX77_017687 [Marasmius sp. AFHP31]|nr:hypothetical protein PQX77_017687 [Marasmius sp. AFHP31]
MSTQKSIREPPMMDREIERSKNRLKPETFLFEDFDRYRIEMANRLDSSTLREHPTPSPPRPSRPFRPIILKNPRFLPYRYAFSIARCKSSDSPVLCRGADFSSAITTIKPVRSPELATVPHEKQQFLIHESKSVAYPSEDTTLYKCLYCSKFFRATTRQPEGRKDTHSNGYRKSEQKGHPAS